MGTRHRANQPALFQPAFDDCDDESENITFQLTAFRDGSSSTASKTIRVPGEDDLKSLPAGGASRFEPICRFPRSTARHGLGVLVNGALAGVVESSQPIDLRGSAAAGRIGSKSSSHEAGTARDSSGSASKQIRSQCTRVKATAGNLVAVQSDAVVFHLAGQAGEHLSFTFELDRSY